MTDAEPSRRPVSPLLWGLVGGAAWGLFEVLGAVLLARLAPGPVAVALLLGLGVLPAAALGAVTGALVGALSRGRARGGTALAGGAAAAALFSLATVWFGRPHPFVVSWPGQGSPVVLGAVTIVLLLVATVAWSRFGARGRAVALGLLAVVGVLVLVIGHPRPPEPATGPNVLLITIDAARPDRFRDPGVDTTATNRVGHEGVQFSRASTPIPYSGPAVATLLAGRPPWEHGVWLDGVSLQDDVATLPEVLREAGWDTAAFLGDARYGRGLGLDRGFRVYDDDLDGLAGARHLALGRAWALWRRGPDAWPTERLGGRVVDRALGWVDGRVGPWFAWVQLGDARPPADPPPPFDTRYTPDGGPGDPRLEALPTGTPKWLVEQVPGVTSAEWLVGRYDGGIAYADQQVARLLDYLDEARLVQNTIVVVTAPHGLTLGEQGRWFRHDGVSDADLQVPLVVRWPEAVTAGTVVREPVELTDVGPTLLGWLGVAPPARWTGASLAPTVQGERAARSLARAVAFDPDPADGEARRVTAVRNRTDTVVLPEGGALPDPIVGPDTPGGLAAEERALLADLMQERARDLLEGWRPEDVRRPANPPGTAAWLAAQGARLEP